MAKARFMHHKKFEPDYNPYGTIYTERQESIIRGMNPDDVSKKELTTLIKKAERLEDEDVVMQLLDNYYCVLFPDEVPKYSIEESKNILQSLTPWTIQWE